jgi:hypothetical protein
MSSETIVLSCRSTVHGGNRLLAGHNGNGAVGFGTDGHDNTHWSRTIEIVKGQQVWTLRCLDTFNPNHAFLDGRTQDGSVGLAPNASKTFSGTRWLAHDLGGGEVALECLGTFKNANFVFLDGRPGNGTVGLAPTTKPPFSGTRWFVDRPSVPIDFGSNNVPASD